MTRGADCSHPSLSVMEVFLRRRQRRRRQTIVREQACVCCDGDEDGEDDGDVQYDPLRSPNSNQEKLEHLRAIVVVVGV